MPVSVQNGLINWGYAACDIGLRNFFSKEASKLGLAIPPPEDFPVPGGY